MGSRDAALVVIAFGGFVLGSGVLFRLGHLRYQASRYWHPDWPLVYRNGVFAQIPGGLISIFLGIGLMLGSANPLSVICLVGALAATLTAIGWVLAPPTYAKPDWIRSRERELGRLSRPSRVEVWSLWLLMGILLASGITIVVGIALR